MSGFGMSIPTLPGGSRRPNSRHPGADNIQRKKDRQRPSGGPVRRPTRKPSILDRIKQRIQRKP